MLSEGLALYLAFWDEKRAWKESFETVVILAEKKTSSCSESGRPQCSCTFFHMRWCRRVRCTSSSRENQRTEPPLDQVKRGSFAPAGS